MILTKAKAKEFFNLVREEKRDTNNEALEILRQHSDLINATVSGMTKGIDGFSSLSLAIRFFKYRIAAVLIESGANVNYIENSDVRVNHQPIFFDLLEMLSNLIEWHVYELVRDFLNLWTIMENHGLDYSTKSIRNDGVNRPENCLQSFIRLVCARYGQNHVGYRDSHSGQWIVSDAKRNLEQEKWYEVIFQKLIYKMNEEFIREIDANHYRASNVMSLYKRFGKVDNFGLEAANKLVMQKFGYSIRNFESEEYLKEHYKTFLPLNERD